MNVQDMSARAGCKSVMHAANTKAHQAYFVSSIFVQGATFLQMCFAPLDFMICKKSCQIAPKGASGRCGAISCSIVGPSSTLNPGPPDPGTPPYNGEKFVRP